MRKFVFSLFVLFLISASAAFAQDGWSSYADARSMMNSYELDPANNKDKLIAAVPEIEKAMDNISTVKDKKQARVYLQAGEIYSTLAGLDLVSKSMDPNYISSSPDAALKAFNAYKKAFKVAQKGFEQKDALEGLFNNINNLNAYAAEEFSNSRFNTAYVGFSSITETVDMLEKNDYGKSPFETEEAAQELAYAAGLSAVNAGMKQQAEDIFVRLKDEGYQNASVYESLYRIYLDSDKEKAVAYLREGRKAFPKDKGLLYAEINYALQNNELEGLVSKLEEAIADDPENVSLYTTMGFVNDNLFQRELEAGNQEKAQTYFDKAMKNYEAALKVDDTNADAIYSIGALYYNKAAVMSQELVAMEDDFSKEGIRKYEAKQAEILGLFDKALPHFKRAETLKPNDQNVMIALKEIYAKKGSPEDLKISQEFSRRLEKVAAGEDLTDSYFGNK